MSLSLDLAAALTPLSGQSFAPAHRVTVSDGSGVTLSVDLLAVDFVGVACEELRLDVPSLSAATLDTLKKWAKGLCQRITYLLENLGPLEYDAQGNEVMIRSTPPDTSTSPGRTKYYEVLLSSHGWGKFSLRRYEADRSTGSRAAVPLRLTHEQLAKLVNDLTGTLPGP
jgi:hypothetical protein